MDKNDNKKWYLVIAIFGIILTFFGGSLAYWQWTSNEEQKTSVALTVAPTYRCDVDGGGNITSGEKYLVPTDCTNSEYAIQRTLSVDATLFTNKQKVSMDLWLDINTINTGLKNSDNFKYAITTSPNSCTNGVVASGTFKGVTTTTDVMLLDSKSFSKTSSELYYLYIWLDKAETNSVTMDQQFDFSLGGECTSYEMDNDLEYNVTNLSNNKNNLDTSFYTLSSYTCENGATLSYDPYSRSLTTSNIDKCDLNFAEQDYLLLYDIVEIGDYISYTGNNGCSGNQCSGWNAYQTATDIYDNFGYCYDSTYKFYTYGFRVLYKTDNSVYIVSAGSTDCVTNSRYSSSSISTIGLLNSRARNYCNTSYLSDGVCDATTAHAFNGDDFYKFTSQYYGSDNARYLYEYNDDGTYGSPYCYDVKGGQYCGYNNSLIDNGGYYWFGSAYSSSSTLYWYPGSRSVLSYSGTNGHGVRPVLKLDSSIRATGGTGTMENPYTISTRDGVE